MRIILSLLLSTAPLPSRAASVVPTLLDWKTIPASKQAGKPRQWRACREAAGGCAAYLREIVDYIEAIAEEHGLDPLILVSMAWHESRLNAFAEGSVGERGVLQIHPSNAKGLAFFEGGTKGERYRAACHDELGACQYEVIERAAEILARAIERCDGNVGSGLSAYNTGRCISERGAAYSVKVQRTRDELASSSMGAA